MFYNRNGSETWKKTDDTGSPKLWTTSLETSSSNRRRSLRLKCDSHLLPLAHCSSLILKPGHWTSRSEPDPPENWHLTVKKLPKTWHFQIGTGYFISSLYSGHFSYEKFSIYYNLSLLFITISSLYSGQCSNVQLVII